MHCATGTSALESSLLIWNGRISISLPPTVMTEVIAKNGRWRSTWTVTLGGGSVELKGVLKVQVHYYEDGNVHLKAGSHVHICD
ncbi:F-actin-capping protein subunit alpha [Portunus trituberculatus]|uniref:F-actin-capping protein subunit alpha n=1 Tax=Portunus trituberculatus TaxID=210409 RepID=A0A5B7E1G4_PORTR|nr:F-actin-capping protein subunit alpha [Portunus trituberculatus]